ncbi:hypothetical protein G6K97_30360 [Agrobacterium rhizogenes]|uniref:hypothetical protein n=1 Tax=Rhizobium rhizogenes TaxID=359 RepID=UPI001572FFDD|nr:hypothetical protein [Rhizobium rhizogenes]NTH79179.1 hypothetical protein [Rhizobium rhizogenes]NTH87455.1 hypothetical protein [Rhizobium rhizogenes]
MHIIRHTGIITRSVAAILLGAALIGSPALANNGKGGGAGNGNGQANGQGANNAADNASVSDPSSSAQKAKPASSLGALDGFLHASPRALTHASAKSEIGRVAVVYGGLLQNYLSPQQGGTPPTLAQVAAALSAAANKPLSTATIQAVNAKLASVNPALAKEMSNYPGGSPALAGAIHSAI